MVARDQADGYPRMQSSETSTLNTAIRSNRLGGSLALPMLSHPTRCDIPRVLIARCSLRGAQAGGLQSGVRRLLG